MEARFETFTVLIAKVSRSIRKIKTEEMAEFRLKSPHVSCLYYLYKMGSLTAKELCNICDEDKAAISRSIEHLEAEGYISCEAEPDSDRKPTTVKLQKRYKTPFHLTEIGKEIGEKIAEKIDRILKQAGEGLDEESRLAFYRGLNLICGNLQKICDEYAAYEN